MYILRRLIFLSFNFRSSEDYMHEGIFKYDMCWQKRGSGRCYDSMSGVGTLMGNATGKVVEYGLRSKSCRVCETTDGEKVPHDCHRNWHDSSKSMEPDVAVEVVKNVQKKGVKVSTIVMDEDSTTLARLRSNVDINITKWSDLNHIKKHLGNSLYGLAKTHKQLTTSVIKTLQRWFGYAIAQNRGNTEGVRDAISQITPHAFGEHTNCGAWCLYEDDPENYRHKTLPKGEDLHGEKLKDALTSLFNIFAANANKLSPCASTKEVESFHNIMHSKAPKARHYSSSGSLKTRVDCAVAQKNIGHTYINEVNTSMEMSPGNIANRTAEKRDKRRKAMNSIENSKEFKKRRLDKKAKRKLDFSAENKREDITYQKNVGLQEHMGETSQPKKYVIGDNFTQIFFDLETASLSATSDILQIAAISGKESFQTYITPTGKISAQATSVHGLALVAGLLTCHGKPVQSLPLLQGLTSFLTWLRDIGQCILVAHNAKFDARFLCKNIRACGLMEEFQSVVLGFVDTLPLMRKLVPNLENYKQETLANSLLEISYDAHNAVADAAILQKLVQKVNVDNSKLKEYGFSLSWFIYKNNI